MTWLYKSSEKRWAFYRPGETTPRRSQPYRHDLLCYVPFAFVGAALVIWMVYKGVAFAIQAVQTGWRP